MITVGNINAMLGFPFGLSQSFQPSEKFYLGLSTTPIRDNGSGFTEPDASCGYERYEIVNGATSWQIDRGVLPNLNQFEFPELISSAGEATHWFLSRTKTGDAEFFGKFTYSRPLAIHSVIFVNAGDLRIILENIRDDEDYDIFVRATTGGHAQADKPRALFGEQVNLLAHPQDTFRFIKWSPNTLLADLDDANPVSSFTMVAEDVEIEAKFMKEYGITVNANEGGSAIADLDVAIEGETVSLTASEESTHGFIRWETQNVLEGLDATAPNASFSMPGADVVVNAVFDQKYSIAVTPTQGGTASADINLSLSGKTITLTANPAEGYVFSSWSSTSNLEGLVAHSANTTFKMPAENVSITAAFVLLDNSGEEND